MENNETKRPVVYHISEDGVARICEAKISCRLGSDAPHFSTEAEANNYSQALSSNKYGVLPIAQELKLPELDGRKLKLGKLQAQLKEAKP